MDESVSWQEFEWVVEDAVYFDSEKEAFCDPWPTLTSSEFGSLSPSFEIVFPDPGDVGEIIESCEIRPVSPGFENPKVSEVLLGDGPPVDDGSLGVSSPGSCSGPDEGSKVVASSNFSTRSVCSDSSGSGGCPKLQHASSNSPVPADSYPELKTWSSESGCNSSDEQVQAKSCNQPANLAVVSEEDSTVPVDEEAKKRIRLMRNRESATQSRLRKKSYIKELEMKCRMLESHCSILQQRVAFTSRENVGLRDELNKINCSNVNGSKSGVVEPAALPSDSLPSESPQRRTALGPFRLADWELLACLYHALLLTLLKPKDQSPARGESKEKRPWFRIRRCQVPWGSVLCTTVVSLRRLRWQMMSLRRVLSCSKRAKKRNVLDGTDLRPISTSVYPLQHSSKRRKHLRKSGRQRRRYEYSRHR